MLVKVSVFILYIYIYIYYACCFLFFIRTCLLWVLILLLLLCHNTVGFNAYAYPFYCRKLSLQRRELMGTSWTSVTFLRSTCSMILIPS